MECREEKGKDMKQHLPQKKIFVRLLKKKDARRLSLARLPFERKIEILLQLQKMAASVRRMARRQGPQAWKIGVSS